VGPTNEVPNFLTSDNQSRPPSNDVSAAWRRKAPSLLLRSACFEKLRFARLWHQQVWCVSGEWDGSGPTAELDRGRQSSPIRGTRFTHSPAPWHASFPRPANVRDRSIHHFLDGPNHPHQLVQISASLEKVRKGNDMQTRPISPFLLIRPDTWASEHRTILSCVRQVFTGRNLTLP
jgi:hypothetical protein